MLIEPRALLRLLQLADSALPVGAAAHSFGLETLVDDRALTPATMVCVVRDWLDECGVADAALCRAGHGSAASVVALERSWIDVCLVAEALKPARESRVAGAVLGRRLLALVDAVEQTEVIGRAVQLAAEARVETQYAPAFGCAASALGIDVDMAALAMLQQCAAALISVCQRASAVGQTMASRALWSLQPTIEAAVVRSRDVSVSEIGGFCPMLDLASMRHPNLTTRLFVS